MAVARLDVVGPAWLGVGAPVVRKIRAWYDGDEVGVSGGTYTLYGPDAVQVFTASIASGGTVTVTVPSGTDPGGGYLEAWSPTLAGSHTAVDAHCSAVVHSLALACPVSHGAILRRAPALTEPPAGQTDWTPQIDEAWSAIGRRLISGSRAGQDVTAIRNPDSLYEPTMELALAYCFQAMSALGGDGYTQRAVEHVAAADAAWGRLALDFALTTSVLADERNVAPAQSLVWPPPGPAQVRRG